MRNLFFISSFLGVAAVGFLIFLWTPFSALFLFVVPPVALGLHDAFQKKKAILRNFPLLGHFRYLFELIGPEIQQYFNRSSSAPFQNPMGFQQAA